LGQKIPHFGEFRGEIEILITHNLLCRKFAISCPSPLFNRRRRCL